MDKVKICKFYLQGHCKKGDQCNFVHKQQNNQQSNQQKKRNPNRRKKNTETFEPSHKPADMRIITSTNLKKFDRPFVGNRDVVIIQNLFDDEPNLYQRLLDEMKSTGIDENRLWKSWHGDSHQIADDKLNWKKNCPVFNMVIDRIADYFNMDVKATRFNWYRDSSEWKPYHHDAAAVKKDKAKTQNFTVGISFGAERDAAFEHAKTRTTVSVPLSDGALYAFSRDVNIEWRHGIPQIKPGTPPTYPPGRISIIAWGWLPNMQDL